MSRRLASQVLQHRNVAPRKFPTNDQMPMSAGSIQHASHPAGIGWTICWLFFEAAKGRGALLRLHIAHDGHGETANEAAVDWARLTVR